VRADEEVRIKSKIDALDVKLNVKLDQAKQRLKWQQEEAKGKVNALQKKAANAKGEAKAKIKKRIAEIEKTSTSPKKTGTDYMKNL